MTYTGETNERDEPHGQGVYEYADGSRYEDQWEDGVPRSQGKMTYPDGEVYEGEWKDDKPHGQVSRNKGVEICWNVRKIHCKWMRWAEKG